MKKFLIYLVAIAEIVLMAALSMALAVMLRSAGLIQYAPGSAGPAATCVPTPLPPTLPAGPPTPTPDRAHFGTVPPPWPTMTPYPIKKTTDHSPGVAMRDKGKVLVFHCDGTYELFLTTDPANAVQLQPGDIVIYRALPESAIDLQAPTAKPFPTATLWPTPVPATATAQRETGPAYAPPTNVFTPVPYPPRVTP